MECCISKKFYIKHNPQCDITEGVVFAKQVGCKGGSLTRDFYFYEINSKE